MENGIGKERSEGRMKIGEIVEALIQIKDDYGFGDYRREAAEEACNLLDKLPRQEEARTYEAK